MADKPNVSNVHQRSNGKMIWGYYRCISPTIHLTQAYTRKPFCFQDLIDLFEPCGEVEMICLQAFWSAINKETTPLLHAAGASYCDQVNQLRNGKFGHIKFFETEAAVTLAVILKRLKIYYIAVRLCIYIYVHILLSHYKWTASSSVWSDFASMRGGNK